MIAVELSGSQIHLIARMIVVATMVFTTALHAETVKDREGAVREDRENFRTKARWIYNDAPKGFAEAKRTGKPLLVVLRCVPCLNCRGLDTEVLNQEQALAPLLDQFVCVRLNNANALDLTRFQFDYDLSFTTMFFNGDGTVYGRFGSWTHHRDPQNTATAIFRQALSAALALHRTYPANKASLAGKQGLPTPFQTPTEMPMLSAKYKPLLDWEGKVAPSCIHCHMVGAAYQSWHRQQRKPLPDEWTYPWPEPETIGLSLAPDAIARIASIAPGSVAARAGIQVGDDLVALGGQPLISVADVSWALHRAPASGPLAAVVKRQGVERALSLTLPVGWRHKSDLTRRGTVWHFRGMVTGGLVLEDLANDERQRRGLKTDALALQVKRVGQFGPHAAAKTAGFQPNDVLVEIDGLTQRQTESELLGYLLQKRFPGEHVKVAVLRGAQRVELLLPMQ